MTRPPPRDKPPHNVNVLGRWLTEAAQHGGVAAGRLRRWLGFMVLAAMLDTVRHADDGQPLFLIKGGVAMELRFAMSARATKDLDTALRGPISGAADHLDEALRSGFGDFTASRTELEPIRDTGSQRSTVRIAYRNKPVVSIPIEIAEAEATSDAEYDAVAAKPLDHLGLTGPAIVPCITIRWQIAQKLHACTETFDNGDNDRFRDVLDLQLLESLVDDDGWPGLRAACVDVFSATGAHAWPSLVTIPDHWRDGYGGLAHDTGFTVTDIDDAAAAITAMIDRIDRAG